ncbi:MAG: hypothetical protein IJQ80_05910 [Clostridia bacterium]|nr:hypothetical protein [Clostridia bacterium]
MKIAFVLLMMACGVSVSVVMLRESAKKVRRARTLFELSEFIEERIRLSATPLPAIIERFNASRGDKESAVTLSCLTESEDPEIRRLTDGICRLDVRGALATASLLKNYTEREMQRVTDEASRGGRVMMVLPPAACLLISLLLI